MGGAGVRADFLVHVSGCLITEQAFWVCCCLLLFHPGEEECCVVPLGLAVGTVFWMVGVLLCRLSWDVECLTGGFG